MESPEGGASIALSAEHMEGVLCLATKQYFSWASSRASFGLAARRIVWRRSNTLWWPPVGWARPRLPPDF
jgi:hypothetical protein